MSWRPMRSLVTWHAQLKIFAPRTVSELPGSVWGLKAGASHAQSGGHYPHPVTGVGQEIVTAADAPDKPKLGLDLRPHLDAVRRSRDDRVLYVISHDQMFSSYAAHGYPPFTWRPYNPGDPNRDRHNDHGHLQVVDDARGDDPRPWAMATTPTGAPTMAFDPIPNMERRVAAIFDMAPTVTLFTDGTGTKDPAPFQVPTTVTLVSLQKQIDRHTAAIADLKTGPAEVPAPVIDYRLLAGALLDELAARHP